MLQHSKNLSLDIQLDHKTNTVLRQWENEIPPKRFKEWISHLEMKKMRQLSKVIAAMLIGRELSWRNVTSQSHCRCQPYRFSVWKVIYIYYTLCNTQIFYDLPIGEFFMWVKAIFEIVDSHKLVLIEILIQFPLFWSYRQQKLRCSACLSKCSRSTEIDDLFCYNYPWSDAAWSVCSF